MLTLHTKSYSHQGKREINEDAVYPHKDRDSSLFVICDGVGGCKNGKYASHEAIDFFVRKHKKLQNPTERDLLEIIAALQLHFYNERILKPSLGNMATTLAGISFSENQAILFWIGDSRICHFRNGEVKAETKDHSYVNKLLENKAITTEEALRHPNKKAITKAINGDQQITPDLIRISNIKVGDYFLIASDGVYEAIPSDILYTYFQPKNNFNQVYHKIKNECLEHSTDNFSFYLIKVINLG